jgi:hypothetical protein
MSHARREKPAKCYPPSVLPMREEAATKVEALLTGWRLTRRVYRPGSEW